MNQKMFNNEVEVGKFLGSIDVIPDAYRALSKTSQTWQLHTTSSGIKVLAFDCFRDYIDRFHNREYDQLVSSENHEALHFILAEVKSKFSINKVAVELFEQHFVELSDLRNQLMYTPLIVTGRGLGGYLAILYTLLHQHAVDVEESNGSKAAKRPICIAFGAPLLGDEAFRHAIYKRPQWSSCFLNVVAKTDTLASFFSTNNLYMPFGTFLFCKESGGHAAFEDQETILAVLDDMGHMASSNVGNFRLMHDYTNVLGSIRRKILYRGASEFGEFNLNTLRAGIVFQFQEIGLLKDDSHDLIAKIEDKRKKRKNNAYEPTKKLNDTKMNLTVIEWYMKSRRQKGGYYDVYKSDNSKKETEHRTKIVLYQRGLNQYWENIVKEKNQMPQKEGAKLRKRWLYGGTSYRRIIEPLDIADHYKKGKTKYMEVRPDHYKLLEQWSEEDKKDQKPSDVKKKAASLTEDSCFWAHVEEALILLRSTPKKEGSSSIANESEIEWLEGYVWNAIENFTVSPDIFLEGSSFMKWWSDYKAYKGDSYDSKFARYMNDGRYKLYQ